MFTVLIQSYSVLFSLIHSSLSCLSFGVAVGESWEKFLGIRWALFWSRRKGKSLEGFSELKVFKNWNLQIYKNQFTSSKKSLKNKIHAISQIDGEWPTELHITLELANWFGHTRNGERHRANLVWPLEQSSRWWLRGALCKEPNGRQCSELFGRITGATSSEMLNKVLQREPICGPIREQRKCRGLGQFRIDLESLGLTRWVSKSLTETRIVSNRCYLPRTGRRSLVHFWSDCCSGGPSGGPSGSQ